MSHLSRKTSETFLGCGVAGVQRAYEDEVYVEVDVVASDRGFSLLQNLKKGVLKLCGAPVELVKEIGRRPRP